MDTVKEGIPLVCCSLLLNVVPYFSTLLTINGIWASKEGRSQWDVGYSTREKTVGHLQGSINSHSSAVAVTQGEAGEMWSKTQFQH